MLESDGLDPATEKRVLLFKPIERRLQLRFDCFGLIGDDDQFDMEFQFGEQDLLPGTANG